MVVCVCVCVLLIYSFQLFLVFIHSRPMPRLIFSNVNFTIKLKLNTFYSVIMNSDLTLNVNYHVSYLGHS